MITYTATANTEAIYPYLEKYNWVKRFAYNRWQDDPKLSLAEVCRLAKQMNNIDDLLDASIVQMAVNDAKNMRKNERVIFGGIGEFNKLKFNRSNKNKDKFTANRSASMLLRGSASDPNGNRKAILDIENNQVIFRPSKDTKITLKLEGISKARKKDLLKLQELCELNQAYFTLRINRGSIGISFDESILQSATKYTPIKGRIMSLDMNHNYIGLVVIDSNSQVIHKELIDYKSLNKLKTIGSDNNRKKQEKHCLCKWIVNLANHYKCEAMAVEKLTMPAGNFSKGKVFNKGQNNSWHRTLINESIKKWCSINQIKYLEIIAAYSSVVGCINNPQEYDAIAAAIEINNRGQKALVGVRYDILPKENVPLDELATHWKEMLVLSALKHGTCTWKELHAWLKKNDISYRFLFKPDLFGGVSLRHKSHKSLIVRHLI